MLSALQNLLEVPLEDGREGRGDHGEWQNFCAGFDIAQFAAQSPEKVKESVSGASQILTRVLEEGAKPTVAAARAWPRRRCEVAAACNPGCAPPMPRSAPSSS